jgi:4-hydroxy-4-methyl-2-oxoglutarate aldolase
VNFISENEMFGYIEKHCYAGAFSDILDEMGFRFQVISPTNNIRPLKDDFVIIGRACTLLNAPDENVEEPYDLVIKCFEELKPDSVLVTTGSRHLEVGIMGELSATALRAKGCRGAIVNGYSRDLRKLKAMNFPTFTWGPSPIDTTGRVRVVSYDIPISIGGVHINPDDLVYSDMDGIVVIPKVVEQEVIAKVLERVEAENLVRQELKDGFKLSDVWNKYHIL